VTPALENVTLWHERDISHSSVERVMAPDATIALDFALTRLTGMIEKLVVYPEGMKKNLDSLGGLVFSQRVLLALTQGGVNREDAYRIVQRNAMASWESGGTKTFLSLLQNDADVAKALKPAALTEIFDFSYYTREVDTIFGRVFNHSEKSIKTGT
jgi:adenylosuccinate lyase